MIRLSLLDYAQIDEGLDSESALKQTVRLAHIAEQSGFTRFWMAEHHDVPAFASSSPEIMMMHLLNQTSSIRIGSGGVMLPHYSPFKVAENFRMMEALFPGRVDLGIGSTIGTTVVNKALNETKSKKLPFEKSVTDVYKYLTSRQMETDHRMATITANPYISTVPTIWLLSASMRSARIAAKLGLGYTFGLFPIARKEGFKVGVEATRYYRDNFQPSKVLKKPKVSIALFLVLGETKEEAENLATALDFWLLGLENFSYYKYFPSVTTAKNYPYTEKQKAIIEMNRSRMIVGEVAQVKRALDHLAEEFVADEILLIPLMPGIENRIRAVESLGSAYQLHQA